MEELNEMTGLRQIQVITQGDGWHLVGLDAEGQLWFGSPRRTANGRAISWILMDEATDVLEPAPTQGLEEGKPRAWPSR